MITTTTSVAHSDRFNIPWLLLHKKPFKTLILWFSSMNLLNNSIWVVSKICFACSSNWFCAILNHITSLAFGETHEFFIQYSYIILLTSSPSLSLYGCSQITAKQANSSFTSICNLNLLCLSNVFHEVPYIFAINFTKQFSLVLDDSNHYHLYCSTCSYILFLSRSFNSF